MHFNKMKLTPFSSAVVRQSADGRLSQVINDALDGAALDGASSGSVVVLGEETSRCLPT